MAATRITVVLDVEHEPELDIPFRAALYLAQALGDVEGFDNVSVIRGETDQIVWTPGGARRAS
jgi:hypothetical protein